MILAQRNDLGHYFRKVTILTFLEYEYAYSKISAFLCLLGSESLEDMLLSSSMDTIRLHVSFIREQINTGYWRGDGIFKSYFT